MITRIATMVMVAGSTLIAAPRASSIQIPTPQDVVAKAQLPSDTRSFLKDTLEDGYWEIEMAKLTASNSNDDRVQRLGDCLRDDHQKANAELRTLMIGKGLEAPEKISSGRMRVVDDRATVVGRAFDKAYLSEMVRAHEAAIADFKKHEDDADPDVKAFVAKTLPVLQEHLDKATALKAEIER